MQRVAAEPPNGCPGVHRGHTRQFRCRRQPDRFDAIAVRAAVEAVGTLNAVRAGLAADPECADWLSAWLSHSLSPTDARPSDP